jgi:hypothetical protein
MQTFNQFLQKKITNEGIGSLIGNTLQKVGSYISGTNNQNIEQKLIQYQNALKKTAESFKDPYLNTLINLRLKSFNKDYAAVMQQQQKQKQNPKPQQNQNQNQQNQNQNPNTININKILGRS